MGIQSFFSETVENQLEFKVVLKVEKQRQFYRGKTWQKKELVDITLTTIAVYRDRCQKVITKISVLKLSVSNVNLPIASVLKAWNLISPA